MSGRLSLRLTEDQRQVIVSRDSDVPDDFWRRLRAEWGQVGPRPNEAVQITLETFSLRQSWLVPACKTFGVGVDVDEGIRTQLLKARADREQLSRALQGELSDADIENLLVSAGFRRALREFQARDLRKLLGVGHGANFSVPGAGKTSVELALFALERQAGRVQQMLVVGPLSSFDAWVQDNEECFDSPLQIQRFAGGSISSSTELLLINYQRLMTAYDIVARWVQNRPTLVVLDEAHRMKRGRAGEWGAACLDLAYLAERRDILTGTPAPQHPADLVSLLDFVWPGQGQRLMPSDALVPNPSPLAVSGVSPAISPLFVRTTKDELGLRETTKQVIKVPLTGLHKEIYQSLLLQFSSLITSQRDRAQFAQWGDITMYLLEAATNPSLLPAGASSEDPPEFRHPPLPIPEGSSLSDLIVEYSSFDTPEKFIQLGALVSQLRDQGRKVLIWSNFVRNIHTVQRMLARYEPAIVHGGIPSELSQPGAPRIREREIDRFRTDPRCGVLIANPAAMGEGVSLHKECHDAIYLDRTFNAGQYLQSVDRIHRLGLSDETETRITFLVSEGTIDEVVAARVETKARNLGLMLDDPSIATMALPDDEDVGAPVDVGDQGDIAALFAHLRGEANVGEMDVV